MKKTQIIVNFCLAFSILMLCALNFSQTLRINYLEEQVISLSLYAQADDALDEAQAEFNALVAAALEIE